MSQQMMEPPDGPARREILREYLEAYEQLRAGLRLSPDADAYIRTFLAYGSEQTRTREAALHLTSDPEARNEAVITLGSAATEAISQLGQHAKSIEITRSDLEVVFQTMCAVGYPPFCMGPGPSSDAMASGMSDPGSAIQYDYRGDTYEVSREPAEAF